MGSFSFIVVFEKTSTADIMQMTYFLVFPLLYCALYSKNENILHASYKNAVLHRYQMVHEMVSPLKA